MDTVRRNHHDFDNFAHALGTIGPDMAAFGKALSRVGYIPKPDQSKKKKRGAGYTKARKCKRNGKSSSRRKR